MVNPALLELTARDRTAELRRTDPARRSARRAALARPAGLPLSARSRRSRSAVHPQRALGWFIVSVGLRLALPRSLDVDPSR